MPELSQIFKLFLPGVGVGCILSTIFALVGVAINSIFRVFSADEIEH